MRSSPSLLRIAICFAWFIPAIARAQAPSSQSRIVQGVNENDRVTLRGNTHPLARPQFDLGVAPPDLPMSRMLLVLKRSDSQEAELNKLLDAQQVQNSGAYHQWLSPDAFGSRFGPSVSDIQAVTAWLQARGFQIGRVSRGRTVIEFSGTASQVQSAFHTEIHKFSVNGEAHWANASDPQIPAALSPVVTGIDSLHNFPKKPTIKIGSVVSKSRITGQVQSLSPEFTFPNSAQCGSGGYCYLLGPADFAKIYNVLPLWNATSAIDGSGQRIAIVGVSNINIQDVRDFRNLFGLAPNDPQVILDGPDPGLVPDAETEADLDVEWSGAVAKGATIILVPDASTNAIDGVDLSALYIVENNVAPVLSESFGECELYLGTAGNAFANAIREQAAAEGITFINSAGDEGVTRCDPYSGTTPAPAKNGFSVSGLASSPHDVAVGGTDFANFGPNFAFSSPSPYWGVTNDSTSKLSALGYIPETTWNSNCTNSILITLKWGSSAEAVCNNTDTKIQALVETVAGGGGKSNCITSDVPTPSSCTGGYVKPSWQSAPGVPADGVRDIPDVSFFASGGFMDSAYIVCESDVPSPHGSCGLTSMNYDFLTVGGTSASAPAFAGIMALVNQYTQSAGQGNANYVLYKLASSSTQRSSNCNASSNPQSNCIFNDVTAGTIDVPCAAGSTNCTPSNSSDLYGVIGYGAGTGYDLATGLGSVNAYNLVHNWIGPATPTTTTLALGTGNGVNITHGQSVPVTVSVAPSAATGDVTLIGNPGGKGSLEMGGFPLSNGSINASTTYLAGGGGNSYQVRAYYAGDSKYAPSVSAPVIVTVNAEPTKALITLTAIDPSIINTLPTYNPASIVYGIILDERIDVGNPQATQITPPHALCTSQDCPSGSVTLSDSLNGGPPTPIGTTGVFQLNLAGDTGDAGVLLAGGSHTLSASYAGDNSYFPSTANYSLTVMPAPTQMPALLTPGTTQVTGGSVFLKAFVNSGVTQGVAPTGTITFFDGTTQLPGSVYYSSSGGFPGGQKANLSGNFNFTFSTVGPHSVTAKYGGDSNYGPSASPATVINVVYPTSLVLSPLPTNPYLGQPVTVSIVVSSQGKSPAMTGSIQFTNGTPNPGPVVPVPGIDANGNQQLTASVTFTPQSTESIYVTYSGDSNYETFTNIVFIPVTVPDFSITSAASSLNIIAGQGGTAGLTVTPATNLPSSVVLSCGLGSLAGATCSFNPASPLTLANSNPASTTVTITTLAPSTNMSTSSVWQPPTKWKGVPPGLWIRSLAFIVAIFLVWIFTARKPRLAGRVTLASVLCLALGCGAGGNGGGGSGGGGASAPTATSLTLSTSNLKAPVGTMLTLNVAVKSSQSATGIVLFLDLGNQIAASGVMNGVATGIPGYWTVGTHVLTAQYLGDANNLPSSTQGSLNVVITGTTLVDVQATTSTTTHITPINITIQ